MSLQQRNRQDEWMDQPNLDVDLHHQALRGLSRVNRISGAARSIWHPLSQLAEQIPGPIRVLDVGSGGGDVAIELKQISIRKGVPIEITGLDISDTAVTFAREQADRQQADVAFLQQDVLLQTLPSPMDFIYSSLFLHHLDPPEIVALLTSMVAVCPRRIVISDLIRSRLGYWMAAAGIRLLTSSKICHFDGPASVRAAMTINEMETLAEKAGLKDIHMKRQWPERFLMVCDIPRGTA